MLDKNITSTSLQQIYHCIKKESTQLAYDPHNIGNLSD